MTSGDESARDGAETATATRERYATVVDDVWPEVRRAFNYPVLAGVRLVTEDDPLEARAFRWEENEVVVSASYVDALTPEAASSREIESVLRPLLKHEVGHYALFPRELADHLVYLRRAEEAFGAGVGYTFYALYADACTDLRLVKSRLAGDDLVELRTRTLDALAGEDDPAALAGRRVLRLLLGLYRRLFPDVVGTVPRADESIVDELATIDYFATDVARHERNVVRFGRLLEEALADLPDQALLGLESPEDAGKGGPSLPFSGDELAFVPAERLDDALSDVLAAQDRWTYEQVKAFLEGRAGFEDRFEDDGSGGAAGLERGDIEPNDDEIPFYRRWASQYPLYVAETPIERDETAQYRSGRRYWELSDPVRRIDPFASLGLVGIPGVSTVARYDDGVVPSTETGVPDLLVGIDSSGSMPRPDEGSVAVLAAFVLAATYRRNGARVGAYNFSGGLAFLAPSRDLAAVQSLLCARWGGGTVLDRDALVGFVDRMDDLDGVHVSAVDDHTDALEREFGADDEPPATEGFASLDHVLVTDGAVANEAAVRGFVERVGERSRTFVFVTDEAEYREWAELDVGGVEVYAATDETDLADLAVGLAKRRMKNGRDDSRDGGGDGDRDGDGNEDGERGRTGNDGRNRDGTRER